MYKNTKSTHKFPLKLVLVVCTVIVVIGVILIVLEKTGVTNIYSRQSVNNQNTTEDVINPKPTNAIDYSEAKDEDNFTVPDKSTDTGQADTSNPELSAIITSTRVSSDGLNYLIKVAVAGTNSGTCELEMSKGGEVLTASSDISQVGGQNSCTNLSVSMSKLTSKGIWNIEVVVKDDAGAETNISDEVTI